MSFLKQYPLYKFVLAFIDFSSLAIAFFVALKFRFWPHIDLINNPDYFIHPLYWSLLAYAFLCLFVFQYNNLYKANVFITGAQHQILILKSLAVCILGLIILTFLVKYPRYVIDSRLVIGYAAIAAFLLVSFFRIFVFRTVYMLFARNHLIRRRVLIVGAGESGKLVAASIVTDKKYGLELVGFVDDYVEAGRKVFGSYIVLGNTDEVKEVANIYNVNEIIICVSTTTHEQLIQLVEKCKSSSKIVQVYSDLYEIVSSKIQVERYVDFPMVRVGRFQFDDSYNLIKRTLDIAGSFLGLLLLSPFYFAVSLAIKLDSPGPVLFRQVRLGKDGRKFTFYKFRTMFVDADDKMHRAYLKKLIKNGKEAPDGGKKGVFKIVDDPRVTRVGKFLRRTSLDEFPQLINVLKGDMSLVGPRPCLPYELEEYNPWHKERMRVLPGITGLWQVSGRSSVNFDDMVVLDLYYIENMSPWFDMQIMLRTIPVVLSGRGGH